MEVYEGLFAKVAILPCHYKGFDDYVLKEYKQFFFFLRLFFCGYSNLSNLTIMNFCQFRKRTRTKHFAKTSFQIASFFV